MLRMAACPRGSSCTGKILVGCSSSRGKSLNLLEGQLFKTAKWTKLLQTCTYNYLYCLGYTAPRSGAESSLTTPEVKFRGLDWRLERRNQTSLEGAARGTSLVPSREPPVQTEELYLGCGKPRLSFASRSCISDFLLVPFSWL